MRANVHLIEKKEKKAKKQEKLFNDKFFLLIYI